MGKKFDPRLEATELVDEGREMAEANGADLAEVVDDLLLIEKTQRTPAEYRQLAVAVSEII